MFLALWEYEVKPGCEERFEKVYGPEGNWAQLFRRATPVTFRRGCGTKGFEGTEIRDQRPGIRDQRPLPSSRRAETGDQKTNSRLPRAKFRVQLGVRFQPPFSRSVLSPQPSGFVLLFSVHIFDFPRTE